MSLYRHNLPQTGTGVFITDGGLETDLYFNRGIELPEFAAYPLLRTAAGRDTLLDYFRDYTRLAARYGVGLILETPTWRANRDWGARLGHSVGDLDALNRAAVALIETLRAEQAGDSQPLVISGCVGPRGDGYTPGDLMTTEQAREYHRDQVASFAATHADMTAAITMNYVEEAAGIALAARDCNMPVCISFTVETDGNLPGGTSLERAIAAVDEASDGWAAYFMINCAHPSHFEHLFEAGGDWLARVKGLRGNASCMSHEELDNSETLDDGNPEQFGRELNALRQLVPGVNVLGGCCGTDHRHIEHVCAGLGGGLHRKSA